MAVSKKSSHRARKTKQEQLDEPTLMGRILWLLAVAAWSFYVLSLIGFNAADWPSRSVAIINDPPANPGGSFGAILAWWSYASLGIGAWVLPIFSGIGLWVLLTGRSITHPLVRCLGVILTAIAIGSLQQAWMPANGPITGAEAGFLPGELTYVLSGRFGGLGTTLIILTSLGLGLLVAADELVLAAPAAIARGIQRLRGVDAAPLLAPLKAVASAGRRAAQRRTAVPQPAGVPSEYLEDEEEAPLEDEYEYEEEEEEEEDEDEGDVEDEYEYEDEYEDEEDEDEEEEEEEEEEEDEFENLAEESKEPATAEELREKIARLPLRMSGQKTEIAKDEDIPREDDFEGYQFPSLELLDDPEGNYSDEMENYVRDQAGRLEETLRNFQIDGEVAGIESGPVVTLYSVLLAPGTRVARLNAIASDIARSLQAQNIRVIPNMAGKSTVGIEVPNPKKEKVRLKELMSTGRSREMTLPMFLGKDSAGEPLVADLAKMPHMLIAGTTGSGKSVCMNTIIMSWLYTKRPDELKMVLFDPKMVEMSQFSDIPHLMSPVVTEMTRAASILEWGVTKMEERYELLRKAGVRDIKSYNELGEEELKEIFQPANDLEWAKIPKKLPYIVFVIDELADLMMTAKEVEHSIVRIAQKARAVGLHLILATQRPQANVVTGLIKSNMPCRVSFKVASGMDSRIVLDQKGAELLLGQGDMMVLSPDTTEICRCQGTLVTDKETRSVARFLKSVAGPTFERSLIAIRGGSKSSSNASDGEPGSNERDPLFDKSVEIMIESGRGSVSLLQRRLAIGYSRASRLVDQMGTAGILGEHKGSVAREVNITLDEWRRMKAMEDSDEGYVADDMVTETATVPDEMPNEYLD